MTIGVQLSNRDGRELVETIRRAEELGVAAVWTPQGGVIPDTMLLLSAAAMVTSRIKLGTSIVPTWPRAPILIAQQAMAMHALAPGRFRLGIGPSTPAAMVPLYGADYRKPLTQLREYLTVIKSFLHEGAVDFKGEFVSARVRLREPIDVPVMASALSAGAFRLCGEFADGAISWMCPWDYLRDVALPALREGAQRPAARRHRWSPTCRFVSAATARPCASPPRSRSELTAASPSTRRCSGGRLPRHRRRLLR